MISAVSKVVLPVDEQERAKELWTKRIGFELRRDGTIPVAWWLRDENGDWAPWMHNSFRRVPGTPVR